MSFKVDRYEKSKSIIPPDVLRPVRVEDKRGFVIRLIESIRAKATVDKSGKATFEATGGATFLAERRITEADAWREVNRPFVVAGVVMAVLIVLALGLAFILAGCINLGPQRVALTQPVAEIPEAYR